MGRNIRRHFPMRVQRRSPSSSSTEKDRSQGRCACYHERWYMRRTAWGVADPRHPEVNADMAEKRWRIELFGGLRAQRGERIVTHFESRKIAALFACLALRLHRVQSREVLAEQLWPEEEWEVVRNRLRQGLSSLRQTLEPGGSIESSILLTDRSEASLDPA